MSKETPDTTSLPLNESSQSMQTSLDQFSSFLSAPVRKLDADEYTANDLDGVTESATGSGNLNFLMMQAGQTNEEIRNLNPFDNVGGGDTFGGGLPGFGNNGPLPGSGNGGETAMDRAFDPTNEYDSGLGSLNSGGNLNSTAGSLGAITTAHTAATPFSNISDISLSDIQPANNGNNGNNGNSGTSGNNGTSGMNGTDGPPGVSGTNGTSGSDGADGVDGNDGEITTIINNFFNELPFDIGPIGISLDTTLDDLSNITLDIINGDTITNVLNEAVDLAPALGPLSALTGEILSGVSLDAILDPFQYDDSANDSDLNLGSGINLLGMELPGLGIDIPLDPIERLIGDIDIGFNGTNNLLDLPILGDILGDGNQDLDLGIAGLDPINQVAQAIINPVENLIGDIDIGGALGLGLLGLDADNGGADTDLSVPLDLGLLDNGLLNNGLNISLDPLENILGDMDLNMGAAGNLLGGTADPLFDALSGGNGENDLLAQLNDGISPAFGDLLPFGESSDTDLALGGGVGILGNDLIGDGLGLAINPIENLVGDIDIGGNVGLGLLGTADSSGTDTDLTVPFDIGLIDTPLLNDTIEFNLDPLESIVGDIDFDAGMAGNLLGNMAGPMIDSAAGGSGTDDLLSQAGDGLSGFIEGANLPIDEMSLPQQISDGVTDLLDNTAIPAIPEIPGADILGEATGTLGDLVSGDTGIPSLPDLVGDLGPGGDSTDILGGLGSLLDVIDTVVSEVDGAISLLDSLPTNTGGLDLGALTGGLGGGAADGATTSSSTTWTETLLPSVGDILGGGLAGDPTSIIPDPIAAVPSISLPVIPTLPVAAPVLGGLFGGHHGGHGGLFG